MKNKSVLILFFVIVFISGTKAQIIVNNIDNLKKKYILDFYLNEEKYSDDYIPATKIFDEKFYNQTTELPEKLLDSSVFVFRSYFIIEGKISNQNFGIHLGPINYPCKIFLNGNLINNVGQLSDKSTTKIQFSSNIYLPPALLNKDSINEISFQAYIKKGDKTSLGKVILSSTKTVETYTFIRNLLREDIVQGSVIFSFILAFYFIFGYFQKRDKSDKKYLFFALFSFGFAVGYANLGLSFNFIDDVILYKITRMGIPFAALMLVYYTVEFTSLIKKQKLLFYLIAIPIIVIELIYLTRTNISGIEKTMKIYSTLINFPYIFFCITLSIIALIKRPRKSNLAFFVGFLVLFAAILHDTSYYSANIIAYTWLVPHAFLFLIITTFFILSSEQTKVYHLSVERGEELQKIKDNLEIMVIDRTQQINQQKEELLVQTEFLQNANNEITKQRDLIKKSHNEITSSINYAHRIQKGLLPPENLFNSEFSDYFIIYKPKDIVSGDFYFLQKVNDLLIIVTGDCTGHGVPGAFMSLLGIAFLKEIIASRKITSANLVLEELRNSIKNALHQKGERDEQKDGIDMSFCAFNSSDYKMQYSGANNSIFVIINGVFNEYKPVRNPIGIYIKERNFENHSIQLQKGDLLYMFTDGFSDQFGGELGRKFRFGNFRKLVAENFNTPLQFQKELIQNKFEDWKQSNQKQTDDVTVIGLKF